MASRGFSSRTTSTEALLLHRLPYGESDLIVRLFTEQSGRVSCLARSARKSQKRFGGGLEPLHTLSVSFDDRAGSDLGILRDASICVPRLTATTSLERMEAAGHGLRWLGQTLPPHSAEPEAWHAAIALLDQLDSPELPAGSTPTSLLASFGLRLLRALGWGLELGGCVVCERGCEPGRSARVDPLRGGLVCRRCGRAPILLSGTLRERLAAAAEGELLIAGESEIEVALRVAEHALRAHVGVE